MARRRRKKIVDFGDFQWGKCFRNGSETCFHAWGAPQGRKKIACGAKKHGKPSI